MRDLIERVEKATGPDRELDALIHRALTPTLHDTLVGFNGWLNGGNHDNPTQAPTYTSSLDAVCALIAEKLPGWPWGIQREGVNDYFAFGIGTAASCVAATPALALLAAALRALEIKETGHVG